MKIVLLNTDDSRGGAARAAIRLHRALLERGDASTLLVRRRTGLHDHVPGIVQASEQPRHPARPHARQLGVEDQAAVRGVVVGDEDQRPHSVGRAELGDDVVGGPLRKEEPP